jgi:hypothetical protein
MPEEDGEPASQVPLPPGRFGDPDAPAEPVSPEVVAAPQPPPAPVAALRSGRPGSLGRLISVIVSVGLAWAIVVASTAWLLGLFLTRG